MSRPPKSAKRIELYHMPPPAELLPAGMTRRAALFLYLHIQDGWSYEDIARAANCSDVTVIKDVRDAKASLVEASRVCGYALVGDFVKLWHGTEQHRKPRGTSLRHEQLTQELERRLDQHETELVELSEVMGVNCPPSHTRSKGQAWTCWEMRYLNETGHVSVPASLYGKKKHGRTPAYYCANDSSTCDLNCAGCRCDQ